ncbi:MAG: OPT/YSL family transporter [bacterium]
MNLFVLSTGIILTIISTAILAYISVATMIGPWIAPTLVLVASLLAQFRKKSTNLENKQDIILIQSIAAGGGIIAVGIGFALPTLYFLDRETFLEWMVFRPWNFYLLILSVTLAAGSLGIFLGRILSPKFIDQEKLLFPVSQLTYKIIAAQSQLKQTITMFFGVASALVLSFLRDGAFGFVGIIPKTIKFFEHRCGEALAFEFWPTLWAIGFAIGPAFAYPLLVGIFIKHSIIPFFNLHSLFLPFQLFAPINENNFITAFCSGLVVSELLLGILSKPAYYMNRVSNYLKEIYTFLSKIIKHSLKYLQNQTPNQISSPNEQINSNISEKYNFAAFFRTAEPIFALSSSIAVLCYLKFSILAQIVFLTFTIIATYEICYISSEIGLLQFGRYSAYVTIPMIFMFRLNFSQITAISVFFSICAATASDLLFDYKTGEFCSIKRSKLHMAQWIGLLVTSVSIGLILHVLFTHLQIGSDKLIASRGHSRALLVQSLDLNGYVVSIGILCGYILKKLKISPTMTFGGIIMPNKISFGLILGGFASVIPKDKEKYIAFCSGVFASEALWILISILFKMF